MKNLLRIMLYAFIALLAYQCIRYKINAFMFALLAVSVAIAIMDYFNMKK